MKIIVPMAGRGSRLRPHTLTVPKPLIPIAGKPIVQRLVEDIASLCDEPIEEIAFIIGDFGSQVEADLIEIAESLGAKGSVYTQDKPLGTAHAIMCAEDSLDGNVIVAFADTLFTADFKLDTSADGVIWVKQVEDPSAFGVVKYNEAGVITEFVEKPTDFVSDLAIIGIYYFKDGERLKGELKYLIDNNIKDKGEFQLTDALENMRSKDAKFVAGTVDQWMDCGNKTATVDTNSRILGLKQNKESLIHDSVKVVNSLIIEPCYIAEGVVIENSKIGPHVSLGTNTKVSNSNMTTSLVQGNTSIKNVNLSESMIGNYASLSGVNQSVSVGDYSVLEV